MLAALPVLHDFMYYMFVWGSMLAAGAAVGTLVTACLVKPRYWRPLSVVKVGFLILVVSRLVLVIRAGAEVIPSPHWYLTGVLVMAAGMVGFTARMVRHHYSNRMEDTR